MSAEKIWLDYTQAELDQQYNQASRVSNIPEFIERIVTESARVRGLLESQCDVQFGPSADELLDIFPAADSHAPVVVFLHGGAWKQLHKDDMSYLAPTFVDRGITYVALNFGLVPDVDLAEQVAQVRRGVAWVYQHAASFGADPEQLFAIGHSSGGHLTGMVTGTDWQKDFALPPNIIKGALAVSGIYDLEPVRLSARNEYLHLDVAGAHDLSPIHLINDHTPPTVIAYGEHELEEFRRQSQVYAKALAERNLLAGEFDVADHNHFEMGDAFANPNTPFIQALFSLIES